MVQQHVGYACRGLFRRVMKLLSTRYDGVSCASPREPNDGSDVVATGVVSAHATPVVADGLLVEPIGLGLAGRQADKSPSAVAVGSCRSHQVAKEATRRGV
jgi:hypothetical protein